MKRDKDYRTFNKLVRDKVPLMIDENHQESEYYIFPENDFENEVVLKLQEETGEYLTSKDPTELSDMLELLMELARLRQIPFTQVEETRQKRLKEKGGYSRRLFLVKVRDKDEKNEL